MRHLTYCSNIHPGEHWQHVLANLNSHALAVKQAVSPHSPFPLGLRISHQASLELDAQAIAEFRAWCAQQDCYLLTINGFPYGTFHQQAVKAAVYDPDWRQLERVSYTKRLADLAVQLMTRPLDISISTVPVAFKPGFNQSDWPQVRDNLLNVLEHLRAIYGETGIRVRLALEPEPCCVLETMAEVVDFFARMNFPAELREFIGLCFDCCHQAVEFESPQDCLAQLQAAGIAIVKVQVSSALRATAEEIPQLLAFDEPVYLHQVVAQYVNAQDETCLQRLSDLAELRQQLAQGRQYRECRAHFHVPIFLDHLGYCGTTQFFLQEFLPLLDPAIPLEVETYSFQNLPASLRTDSVAESIARELRWVNHLLNSSSS